MLCLYGSSYKLVDVLTRQTSKIVRHEAAGDDNRKNSEASTRYGTVWRLYCVITVYEHVRFLS